MFQFKEGVEITSFEEEEIIGGDGGIILDSNQGRFLSVNQVAIEIIKKLLETDDINSVINSLADIYEADREQLAKDIENLINRLHQLDLITDKGS